VRTEREPFRASVHRDRSRSISALTFAACILTALTLAGCGHRSAGNERLADRVFSDPAAAGIAEAAADCDVSRMKVAIAAGGDPSAVGDRQTSLLQWTMLMQCKPGMDALLDAGADSSHTDDTGATVMEDAARADDPDYLDILLAHHVDPNTLNPRTGNTPLIQSILGNRDAQFHKLLAAGADVNLGTGYATPLSVAAKINDYDRILDLLAAGADPSAHDKLGRTFQRWLNVTPENILTSDAKQQRAKVLAWLRDHDVPIEGSDAGQ